MDIILVQKNIAAVAAGWSSELAARLERSALDKADFATLLTSFTPQAFTADHFGTRVSRTPAASNR